MLSINTKYFFYHLNLTLFWIHHYLSWNLVVKGIVAIWINLDQFLAVVDFQGADEWVIVMVFFAILFDDSSSHELVVRGAENFKGVIIILFNEGLDHVGIHILKN